MKFDMLKDLLEDINIASLTLYLVNGKEVKVSAYNKDKSDNDYLYVTGPDDTFIVSLKYVVSVHIHFPVNYDAIIEFSRN